MTRKEQLEQIMQSAREQLWHIQEAENQEALGQYVGCFFKYRNNYSCPEKESDYWFDYLCVDRVEGSNLVGLLFSKDSNGQFSIIPEHYTRHHSDHIEISADEFNAAKETLLNELKSLL